MADISKITLPSGNTYDIKDAVAREMISGGVSFIIAWDGTGTPDASEIPKGVVAGGVTGTLEAGDAQPGAFYLVKSSTTPSSETLDIYDEYAVVGSDVVSWEKIGDTKLNLADAVTGVSLSKSTDTVIGTDSTFTITQPTVALSTGATAGSGVVSLATGINTVTDPTITLSEESSTATGRVAYTKSVSTTKAKATASGTGVAWNSKDTVTALTGVKVTAQPTVTLASGSSGDVTVATGIGAATTKYLSSSASGTGVAWNSKDSVTALTGLGTASTKSAIGASSTFTITQPTIALATESSSATGRVQLATGGSTSSSTNTDWLKGVSVSNETLVIGAATLNQTYVKATASGANTAWNSKDTVTAVTGYASPTTDTVIGTDSTFTVTNPTITLTANDSSATGRITYVQAQGSASTTKLSASASGTAVGANGTDTVIGTDSTFTVTDPSVTLSTGSTGDITVATGGTTKYMAGSASGTAVTTSNTNVKATASGANTAWNSKDSVTVLTNNTSLSVTKGE